MRVRIFSALNEMYEDNTSAMEAEAQNYVKGKKSVTNALGESYTVEYREHNEIPDQLMAIDISSDRKLIRIDCKMKNSLVPEEIVCLFSENLIEYYYATGDHSGYKGGHVSKLNRPFHFFFTADSIFQDGEKIFFDERRELTEIGHKENLEFAKTLRRNITRTKLVEKFRACGYDDTFMLKVYDYK